MQTLCLTLALLPLFLVAVALWRDVDREPEGCGCQCCRLGIRHHDCGQDWGAG